MHIAAVAAAALSAVPLLVQGLPFPFPFPHPTVTLQRRCDNHTDGSTLPTATPAAPPPAGGGGASTVQAGKNWVGSNLYYAAGLNADQRKTLLTGLQKAGVKVLRVWLDGQSSASTKNTPIDEYPSLESSIGTYDDTVLNKLDDFMLDAKEYGVKLEISMHSFNALSGGDVYGSTFGSDGFYTSTDASTAFDNRMRHVLNYQHNSLGKAYKDLREYIFAFEAQNEAMIGLGEGYIRDHQGWQCDRATAIRAELGNSSGILITTGGESWANESVQDGFLNCDALDIVALHAYGDGDFNTESLKGYVDRAKQAGKMLVMQEWGACYYGGKNNECQSGSIVPQDQRKANIVNWSKQIVDSGMPAMYWQILPNADPHYGWDYEVGVDDPEFESLVEAGAYAATVDSAWDWSAWFAEDSDTAPPTVTVPPSTTTPPVEPVPTQTPTSVPSSGSFPKNKVWSGNNLYYAAGLTADQRKYFLQGMKDAGMSVLRVWLDGQGGQPKGTQIDGFGGLEPDTPGGFDDTVLNRLDDFMLDAKEYGIKLMISIHSFNSLQAANDVYGKYWGTGDFYTKQEAQEAFDSRIAHVINHEHTTLKKKWSELSDYIFAFEDQNEAMIGNGQDYVAQHQGWHCDRANAIKAALGPNSGILATTGGASWVAESWMPELLDCDALDIIALHSYGAGEFTVDNIKQYVDQGAAKGKMVVVQEWGVCYHNGSNQCQASNGVGDQDARKKNIVEWANNIAQAGAPWMYWQAIPNDDPHSDWDYEIGIGYDGWEELKQAGNNARNFDSLIDYSPYLL